MQRIFVSFKSKSGRSASKGQSFVELSLVVLLLALLVAGIAEYGFLLNHYLNVIDGAREGARYGSNFDPFPPCGSTSATVDADGVCSDFYENTALETEHVIYPVTLDPTNKDDILISFFVCNSDCSDLDRYPSAVNGWSWSEHIKSAGRYQNSKQDKSSILQRMITGAPNMHVLLVEVFYNYPQTLKMPLYEQIIPDPIPVYTYAIMPIKNLTCPSGPGTC